MTQPFFGSGGDDPFSVPSWGPQPGDSPFFDFMISDLAQRDPVTQTLIANLSSGFDPPPETTKPTDWHTLDPVDTAHTIGGIPEGSHYSKSKDVWLLPDGSLRQADMWTRPTLSNFGSSFSGALAQQSGLTP